MNREAEEQSAMLLTESDIQVDTIYDKVTVVSCKIPNGFVITASSGAVDVANYEDKLWELEGYALAKKLAERER